MQTGANDPKKIRIGEILLSRRLISHLELNAALAHQKRWGGRLGTVLTNLGFITEEVLINVLAEIFRLPIVNLAKTEICEEATNTIGFDLAKKHNVLPLKVEAGARKILHLAVSEPSNMEVLDKIRFLTGISQIKTYLSSETDIRNAIERVYLSRASPGRAVLYSPLNVGEEVPQSPDMIIIRGGKEELLTSGLQQGEKGASGSLADLGLTDIIQILGAGGKTAEITLQCGGEEGKIYLEGGQIVHALQRYLQGEAAFYEMLKWSEGNFTIIPYAEPIRSRTIHVSNDGLILEGLRQQDEADERGEGPEMGISFHEVSGDSAILVEAAEGSDSPPLELTTLAEAVPGGSRPTPIPGLVPDEVPPAPSADPGFTPIPIPALPTPMPIQSAAESAGARKPYASPEVQLKFLLMLLLKKGVISEQEARIILYGKS